jgi:hypothetical protein
MNRQARPVPSVANEPETWMRNANTCPVRKCAYPYRRKLDGIRIHSDRNHPPGPQRASTAGNMIYKVKARVIEATRARRGAASPGQSPPPSRPSGSVRMALLISIGPLRVLTKRDFETCCKLCGRHIAPCIAGGRIVIGAGKIGAFVAGRLASTTK